MNENITANQKLECEKYSLDSCILVKASVEETSKVIRQYFGLEVQSKCQLIDYINAALDSSQEEDRQREILRSKPNKSLPLVSYPLPFWQYLDREWSILPFFQGDDSITFAFASLLSTDAICFKESRHAVYRELKVFRQDRLVEKYLFGSECGQVIFGDWDINLDNLVDDYYWSAHEHHFKSSIRTVAESEVRSAFLSRIDNGDDRGFLDRCLRYYGAYIPLTEETPFHYEGEENLDFQQWESCVERMDVAIGIYNWGYFDRNVPTRVS